MPPSSSQISQSSNAAHIPASSAHLNGNTQQHNSLTLNNNNNNHNNNTVLNNNTNNNNNGNLINNTTNNNNNNNTNNNNNNMAKPLISSVPSGAENRLMWQQLLQQFQLLTTQSNESQQQQIELQKKVARLESIHLDNRREGLLKAEKELEILYFKITQSTSDDEAQHLVELMNLISIRVHSVEYNGMALRDLFLLRRGNVSSMISSLTVQSYISWLQKRLEACRNNPQATVYYNTLLTHVHHTHPIMERIELTKLYLRPFYFPTEFGVFAQTPPTPIEYHRLLIAIAYDLPYSEASIMPLITHFGLPVFFPKNLTDVETTTQHTINKVNKLNSKLAAAAAITNPVANPEDVSPSTSPTSSTATTTNNNNHQQQTGQLTPSSSIDKMVENEPTFYVGYSTHVSSQLYHPLWFGILSRPCFQDELMTKSLVDGDSFASAKWFSTLCRAGYVLDLFVRIATNYPLEGLYPQHHAYSIFLARFFSTSEDSLTNPNTFPRFGASTAYSKIYSFLLFMAAHLGIAHGYELQWRAQQQHQPQHNELYMYLETRTYPYIRDVFYLAMKQRIDLNSLRVFLTTKTMFDFMTPNERSKSVFSRQFGMYHFKIGALAKFCEADLGVQVKCDTTSPFNHVVNLHLTPHLERFFNRTVPDCCDKQRLLTGPLQHIQPATPKQQQQQQPISTTNNNNKSQQTKQ